MAEARIGDKLAGGPYCAGPLFPSVLTHNPNELPAVWCFFSIAILCVGLSPLVRRGVETRTWWGIPVKALGG